MRIGKGKAPTYIKMLPRGPRGRIFKNGSSSITSGMDFLPLLPHSVIFSKQLKSHIFAFLISSPLTFAGISLSLLFCFPAANGNSSLVQFNVSIVLINRATVAVNEPTVVLYKTLLAVNDSSVAGNGITGDFLKIHLQVQRVIFTCF
jgi:hypothetical protein